MSPARVFGHQHRSLRVSGYRSGDRCPACGRSHWHVGRMTAECAYCATVLPLALAPAEI